MEAWQDITKQANRLYRDGDWEDAESLYQQAKLLAQKLLLTWSDPRDSVAALVVSYHNLADLFAQRGQHAEQQDELKAAHDYLLTILQSSKLTSQQLDAVLGGVNRTYTTLIANVRSQHSTCMQS